MSQKKSLHWKNNRYRDGIWIPHRKRTYLYWFKFLQEAQRSPDFTVNWNKYRGWGGANEVMGSRFDDWWEAHWKDLFGVEGSANNWRGVQSDGRGASEGLEKRANGLPDTGKSRNQVIRRPRK